MRDHGRPRRRSLAPFAESESVLFPCVAECGDPETVEPVVTQLFQAAQVSREDSSAAHNADVNRRRHPPSPEAGGADRGSPALRSSLERSADKTLQKPSLEDQEPDDWRERDGHRICRVLAPRNADV